MKTFKTQKDTKAEKQAMDLSTTMWNTWTGTAVEHSDISNVYDEKNEKSASDPAFYSMYTPTPGLGNLTVDWVNAFAARLIYDVSRNPHWMGKIKDRIQRKLSAVRLPYFIETLTLTQLEPGTTFPRITAINEPSMNEWGLWIDAKVSNFFKVFLKTRHGESCVLVGIRRRHSIGSGDESEFDEIEKRSGSSRNGNPDGQRQRVRKIVFLFSSVNMRKSFQTKLR
jgi:hypothetical protein